MPSIKMLTETEWLAADDPHSMVGSLPNDFGERAYAAISDACFKWLGGTHLLMSADKLAEALVLAKEPRIDPAKRRAAIARELAPLADLLREIAGNPFRTVQIDEKWLTSNSGAVTKLARSIYDQQDFQRMTELGDALEKAGCSSPDVLNHCRQPAQHVRGCWLIDLVLSQ